MALNQKSFGDIITFTRASAATRINSLGVMESVAANVPRIDYNPVTLAVRGLLIEEQRTNFFINSVLAGGGAAPTGWAQGVPGSGTSNPVASVFGGADGATAYQQSAVSQRPFISQVISASANTIYSAGFIVESISGLITLADVLLASPLPSGATVSYKKNGVAALSTDSVSTGTYEVNISVGATGGSLGIRLGLGTSAVVTGDISFSRPRIESGSFITSFIPTTTAQVTRAADSARINTLSPWYNAAEGTIFAEITPLNTSSGNHAVWIGSGFDNYIGLQYSTAAIQKYNYFRRAGTFYMPVGARGDAISGETLKTATSYKSGQKIIESYGGINRDGSDVLPAAPVATALALCVSAGGTGVSGARYIRKLRYYPKAMTNAEIAALTA